jgi:hypothetical protein
MTANDIVKRVAAELGVAKVQSSFQDGNDAVSQMLTLLNVAGEELCLAYPWEFLVQGYSITTVQGQGSYPLPEDFVSMLVQTGWVENTSLPLGGPLTAQEWTYLIGRGTAPTTLYATFRISEGTLNILPQPTPEGLEISFEYMSNGWVQKANGTRAFEVTEDSDIVLFDRTLITRYLKLKQLEASGFDTTKAQGDVNQVYALVTGSDKSARTLNAGGGCGDLILLGPSNVPYSGFGQ